MEVRASALPLEKRRDIERAFEIAALAAIEPVTQMLQSFLRTANETQAFSALGVAFVALHEEMARLILASVVETVARDPDATREEMKLAVKCMQQNLNEWFAELQATEIDRVANFYDLERSQAQTKQ